MAKTSRATKSNEVAFPGQGALKERAEQVLKSRKNSEKKTTAKMNMKMNKTFGQHLLKNPGIVTKIIEAAGIKRSDVVLEIGPGTGNLTVQMCGLARKVRALEIDQRMVAEVKRRVVAAGHTNLEVVHGDAMKTDFGEFNVCTANLPYQISSPFMFRLISWPKPYRCAVLMFQLEFGERLIAQPGDKNYCRLSVNCQLFSKITRVCNVSANSFNPPPKVDSIVVKVVPKPQALAIDYYQWDGMLRILFSRKRKTLRGLLTNGKTARKMFELHQAFRSANAMPQLDELASYKEYITKILQDLVYSDGSEIAEITAIDGVSIADHNAIVSYDRKRAVDLTIEDFTKLLIQFTQSGIRFPAASGKKIDSLASSVSGKNSVIPDTLFFDNDTEGSDME